MAHAKRRDEGLRATARALVFLGAVGAVGGTACSRSDASQKAPPDGRALFEGACARCHGAAGTGGVATSTGSPAPRNFCDHGFHAERTDDQLKRVVVEGKGTAMPAFGKAFDDAQLSAIVAHIRKFDPGAGATAGEGTSPR